MCTFDLASVKYVVAEKVSRACTITVSEMLLDKTGFVRAIVEVRGHPAFPLPIFERLLPWLGDHV